MGKISLLDETTVNLIAAGEVVTNPASVVKELVENALDAGARNISVEVSGGGKDLIIVEDDGEGISETDLPLALLRHATSKIKNPQDLDRIKTMGFRGEALPSIASVSRLTVVSRPPAEISAASLKVEGGKQGAIVRCAAPPGTRVEVRDLFYNTPARKKFLSSSQGETLRVSRVITAAALGNPKVSFTYRSEGRVFLKTTGRGKLEETLLEIFGKDSLEELLPVEGGDDSVKLTGFVSKPSCSRRSRSRQYFMSTAALWKAQAYGMHGNLLMNR